MNKVITNKLELRGTDADAYVISRKDKHGKDRTIAHVYPPGMAEKIVRAVNTFDQAREALKHSLNYLLNTQRSLGIKDGSDDEFVSTRMCREALAAMEAEPA